MQVLADSGKVHNDGDAQGFENLRVANTAELENLRRFDATVGGVKTEEVMPVRWILTQHSK